MPGFVIHLAVANEYIRKNKNDIKEEDKFLDGVIAPDFTNNKSQTHYGEKSSKTNLRKYLEENEIKTDFDKGYFLHLVTDYIFYNKVLNSISTDIYNDYDILNEYLIEKYKVKITDNIKDYVHFKDGETKILSKKIVDLTIDMASSVKLEEIKNKILNSTYCEEWEKIRILKNI